MEIFTKNKNYSFPKIIDTCNKNGLITVDCLKDENMISIEKYNDGELGDSIYEFKKSKNGLFKLTWVDENPDKAVNKITKFLK